MSCVPLPDTGLDATFGPLLILGTLCLIAGALVLLARGRRGRAGIPVLVLLVAGAGLTVSAPAPAQAATSGCSTSPAVDPGPVTGPTPNSLTITQTSTLEGLAPGADPLPITGQVVNNGSDSTYLTEVDVAITAVTPASDTPPGTCDASDYVLLDPRMPVGRTLEPNGDSTPFAGASIGFDNKSTNQDACKNATVRLRYTANPG